MNPLALCHFTLVEAEPPAFVDIAAQAGFAAVGLMIQFPRSYGPGLPMAGRRADQRVSGVRATRISGRTARGRT